MRSLVRWAGSKKKLLPKLSQYWDGGCERYLEAFAGSASLYFHLKPGVGLLNDLNEDLIGAYRVLRDDPVALYERVTSLDRSSDNYYKIRSIDVESIDAFEKAVRFFYLNRLCFNGIYRTNSSGGFNVPYGAARSGNFPTLDEWKIASDLLKKVELHCTDFERFLMKNSRSGDFIYLDPPYAVSNRRIFRQYSAQTFGLEDVARLENLLIELDARGCKFVLSYAKSPETKRLSSRWLVNQTLAQRNVAGFSKHRRRAVEVFITNINRGGGRNG